MTNLSDLVTKADLALEVDKLNERMDTMATQDDINRLTGEVNQVATDLAASVATVQSELDALQAANPTLDLSGLETAVSTLDTQAQAVGTLAPQPAPAPTPPPPAPAAASDQPNQEGQPTS